MNPMLFIALVELISRKTGTRDILWKLLNADNLTMEADGEEQLTELKDMFSSHVLKVSVEQTEVLLDGQQTKELEIHREEKKLKQREFSILGWGGMLGQQLGY